MHQQRIRMSRLHRAGPFGFLAICCLFVAFPLLVSGASMVASSNDPTFQSDFFKSTNDRTRTTGTVLLICSGIAVLLGISICAFVFTSSKFNLQPGATEYGTNQSLVVGGGGTGPTVVGPQSTGYNSGYDPSSTTLPVYPPVAAAYPPTAPTYPQGQVYPPPGSSPNPPAAVNYLPEKSDPSAPPSPPPSYDAVVEKKS